MDNFDFAEYKIKDVTERLKEALASGSFPGRAQVIRNTSYELIELLEEYFWGVNMGEKILAFVKAFIEDNGYSPTVREIGQAVGVNSTSHISWWIDKLVTEGKMTKKPNIARSVRVM